MIADTLARLDERRRDLADNLVAKGVAAERTETLGELVPKVLEVPSGTVPEVGFVPSEWNAQGFVTQGLWYGTTIPNGAFAGSNATRGGFQALERFEHNGVTTIGTYAFTYCGKLIEAIFPLVISIGNQAFSDCSSLTAADFPLLISIGTQVFYRCSSLTTVDFPLLISIGGNGFQSCSSLTTADFPLLTSIDLQAFYTCSSLTALILRSPTRASLSNINAFTGTPIASGTGYIYVPAALIESYKTATNWVTYANQFRAIEDYPEVTS